MSGTLFVLNILSVLGSHIPAVFAESSEAPIIQRQTFNSYGYDDRTDHDEPTITNGFSLDGLTSIVPSKMAVQNL
ncbi:MAG TPA: hypothetical protein DCK95_00940 [Anaerolineaceae bacterium]|nr:hypothetical protein [Anaerolineaceae bacterium]